MRQSFLRTATAVALLSIAWAERGGFAQDSNAPSAIRAQPLEPETSVPVDGVPESFSKKEDLLAYADLLYSKQQYPLAARQYQLFLQQHPNSPNAQVGWFRLGECYLEVGQQADAATTFKHVIDTYKQGIFVGSAAYRLAVMKYNAKDFAAAALYFDIATAYLSSPDAALQAQFYLARCQQLADEPDQAATIYQKVLDAKAPDPATAAQWENPFRERSLLELARLQYDVGNAREAFAKFEELATSAGNAEYREEAYARAGLLASELGELETSNDYLAKALEFEGENQWKSLATVGLIFNYFSAGEYEKVIGMYSSQAFNAPDDTRPKMLLIVGHSYRLTDNLKSAIEIYELVEQNYRERPEGSEAGYRRLQCLNQMGDAGFPIHVTNYVDRQREIDPGSEFIDLALLMRAEWNFAKAQSAAANGERKEAGNLYAEAAVDYAAVRGDKIPEKYLEPRLYKLGWSQSESGDASGAIITLGEFDRAFPSSELMPSALAKRAETYQSLQDFTAALEDFRALATKYPDATEAEFSLQQIARIHGHRREIDQMISAYRELLEKYPDSSASAEASYWIGVGLFEQEKYEEAIPELETARKKDPENYGNMASLRLVLSHYQAEHLDELAKEAGAYLDKAAKDEKMAPIPPKVLGYLGRRLFDRQDYQLADRFLAASTTPGDPTATSSEIWDLLGQARMKLKDYAGAVEPLKNFLTMTQRPSLRAQALLELGRAYLQIKQYDKALESARESLSSLKEGRTNAEARVLVGDIAMAQGDPATAGREYTVMSQIFVDPELTPLALTKAIKAFRQAGDEEQATKLEAQLKSQYPEYKP
ncbi:MAG: tetratricopeptide repeat protein [Verrucomicrobiae bacterium]|nr:tetratricopeptide repeat protein [Verrucomicrobiae bacterium]